LRVERRHAVGHQVDLHRAIHERHRRRVAGHAGGLIDAVQPIGAVNLRLAAKVVIGEHRVLGALRLAADQSEDRVDEVLVLVATLRAILLAEVGVRRLVLPVKFHHGRHIGADRLGVAIVEFLATLARTAGLDVLLELRHAHQRDDQVAVLGDADAHRHDVA